MFERFTDRARRVLVLAQQEAMALQHNFLGTEHILLGLISEGEGVGAKALESLGFRGDELRARVVAKIGPGAAAASGPPPFTPRAKKSLELSLREALQLGHNYIGTEHVLLGLIREGEGVASQVLVEAGVALGDVRAKVIELLSGYSTTAGGHFVASPKLSPAGGQLIGRARILAKDQLIGSQHYLLAMMEDENSLGARVLGSLGVTPEAVRTRLEQMTVEGTSDEPSAEREVEVSPGVTVKFATEELAKRFRLGEISISLEEISPEEPPEAPPAESS